MHARTTHVQLKPGRYDEAVNLYQSLEPLFKQEKGFRSARLLTDRSSNKAISITIWDSQADLEANEASGWYREVIAKFADTFATPPDMAHYDVTVEV